MFHCSHFHKNIPIEAVELSKDNVIAFSFEPKGTRFAIIHADATQAAARPNVSIYNIEPAKIVLLSIGTFRSPFSHSHLS